MYSAKCARHIGQGITSVSDFRTFFHKKGKSVLSLSQARLCNTLHNLGPQESLEPGFAIYYAGEKFEDVHPHYWFSQQPMEVVQRIPTGLWENLQEVLWRMDAAFLRDISQITKIPYNDLRKVIPTRGVSTRIVAEGNEQWWSGSTCCLSVRRPGGMWLRCSGAAFEGPCCFKHKAYDGRGDERLPDGLMLYSSLLKTTLVRRVPVRIEGKVFWVCEGSQFSQIYDIDGNVVPGLLMNYDQRWVIETETETEKN